MKKIKNTLSTVETNTGGGYIKKNIQISIVMLVHNAKQYTIHSIKSLNKTKNQINYELIVVDNDSNKKTKSALLRLQKNDYIDKLVFLNKNTYFAKGNNIGSRLCSEVSKYILLLNSDVEIRNKKWLNYLVELLEKDNIKGVATYGLCENNPYTRGDGYCFLINKELYLKYQLDENFEWWWSITKLQANLLKDGYSVIAVRNHNELIYHYGGMSGKSWKKAKGLQIEGDEVKRWFKSKKIIIVDDIKFDSNDKIYSKYNYFNFIQKLKKIKSILK